jgi:hypothetical protein
MKSNVGSSLEPSPSLLSHFSARRTLDILTNIDLTYESTDPTSLIFYDDDGDHPSDHIWILLRSTSNTLQAWNQSTCQLNGTICLNNLIEKIGRTQEQIAALDELTVNDDTSSTTIIDNTRITSFLIHQDQLWIGTSTGVIMVFGYAFQRKSIRPTPTYSVNRRSYSVTSHMINGSICSFRSALPDLVSHRKQERSRSESAMIDLSHTSDECWEMNHCHYRIAFPMKAPDRSSISSRRRRYHHTLTNGHVSEKKKARDLDSGDTSTTLASVKTRSSSPAVISSDEYCQERSSLKLPAATVKQQKSLEASSTLTFNLVFKAKIADAPVKCICKTK